MILIAGVAGYALFRIQTPVSLEDAVDRFRAGNDGVTSDSYEVDPPKIRAAQTEAKKASRKQENATSVAAVPTTSEGRPSAASPEGASASSRKLASSFDVMPAEGVYGFEGSGEETINGIRRPLEKDSHRIITHEDRDTWQEHHMFQEERQSWTRITTGSTGRLVHSQRNLIGIAGQTVRDTDVPFHPPIKAVLFPHRIGHTWSGRFEGRSEPDGDDYTGTLRARVIGDEVWRVGGKRVRVLGHELEAKFEGELEANVTVRYWFAPLHGLTVQEYYSIDAKVDAWTTTQSGMSDFFH